MNRLLLLSGLFLFVLFCSAQSTDYLSHFSEFEINSANTAKDADYLKQAEKDIFLYNNLARMYPKKFYQLYKEFATESPYQAEMFQTDFYYTSLSKDLLNRPPSGALLPDRAMFDLAECWALESGEKGIVGHDRIDCKGGFWAENCSYGYSDGLAIVMQLLIDHSVKSLGHRKNMLNSSYKGLGVAVRSHKAYGHCAVQDFTYTNDLIRAEDKIKSREAVAQQKEEDKQMEIRSREFGIAMGKWTNEEKSNADVSRNLTYLNELEKDFYYYANLMRLYPKKFEEVLWDKGPYFDQLLEDLRQELHQEIGYQMVSNYLKTAPSKPAFIPTEINIQKARCVAESFINGGNNPTNCLKGNGSWQIQAYYPEDNYKDTMEFLMESKTFQALFNQGMTVAISDGNRVLIK